MLKFYRTSQQVQREWIRKHPVQYIALNAILFALWIGYIELKDRREMRKLENETAKQD